MFNELCELQNEAAKEKQDLRCNEHRSDSASKFKNFNPLLTDADRSWIVTHTQNLRRGRKSLQDYLQKNHEIFTLQYILNVKHHEIEHLENHLHEQERLLTKSEKYILEDIALFDQFLDAWNRNVSEVTLRADEESRKTEALVNEIKRLQKILSTYHNDETHLIDTLKQSRRYQQFLFKFAPEEWRDDVLKQQPSNSDKPIDEDDSLYFTKPEQLLDIFTEMEEKSLPLVQKSQSTSEILEQIHSTISSTIIEQNHQVEQLQLKIDQLEELIKHEIDREISCQNILIEYKNFKSDPLIDRMKQSIEILYKKYLTSDDIGISTVHMLQLLEHRIKYIFNQIETMDSGLIIEAEKSRELNVRLLEHRDKLRQEKFLNDLKHQKALLRASAPPYPKIGRKIIERSRPFDAKKSSPIKQLVSNKQEDLIRLLEN